MIAKVRKGSDFAGVLRYLYGPGRNEEHRDPRCVAANVVGDDPRTLAAELRGVAAQNERVERSVAHFSLRLPEGESLDDEQWGRASQTFLREMGFLRAGEGFSQADAPYVAVRHGDDHAHVVAARVRFDGRSVSDSFDYERSHRSCRAVEREFGLRSAAKQRGD